MSVSAVTVLRGLPCPVTERKVHILRMYTFDVIMFEIMLYKGQWVYHCRKA